MMKKIKSFLDLVNTDNKPELTINGIDYSELSIALFIITLILLITVVIMGLKIYALKEKIQKLENKNNEEDDE